MIKKTIPLLIPFVVFVVSVLVVIFAVMPWVREIQELRKTNPEQEEYITKLQRKLNILSRHSEEQLGQYLLDLEFVLPHTSQPPIVLSEVEQIAGRNNLSVSGTQFTGLADSTTEVEMSMGGAYDDMANFLELFVKSAPIVSIETFTLSRVLEEQLAGEGQEQQESSPNQSVVEAGAPYVPIPEDLGPEDSPVADLTANDLELIKQARGLQQILQPLDEDAVSTEGLGKDNPFAKSEEIEE